MKKNMKIRKESEVVNLRQKYGGQKKGAKRQTMVDTRKLKFEHHKLHCAPGVPFQLVVPMVRLLRRV